MPGCEMRSGVLEAGSFEFSPASLAELVRSGHVGRYLLRHEPGHCDRIGRILYWRYIAVPGVASVDVGQRLGISPTRVQELDVRGCELLIRVVRRQISVGESIRRDAPGLWHALVTGLPR